MFYCIINPQPIFFLEKHPMPSTLGFQRMWTYVASVQTSSLLLVLFSTLSKETTRPEEEVVVVGCCPAPKMLVHWLVSCKACDVRRSISEISCSVSGSRQGSLPWRLTRSLLSTWQNGVSKVKTKITVKIKLNNLHNMPLKNSIFLILTYLKRSFQKGLGFESCYQW